MAPRALLFDLDETLLDRARAIRKYCGFLQDDFSAELGGPTLDDVHAAVVAADDFGSRRQAERLALSPIWRGTTSADVLEQHWANRFGEAAVAFPGALELLRSLSDKRILTGIITNGGAQMQRRKIAALGLEPLLDTIVISSEVGLRKPDAAIFALALKQVSCAAERAWFVGDHPDVDVRGADAAGLRPFWVKTGAIHADDVPGTHLNKLADLLMHLD